MVPIWVLVAVCIIAGLVVAALLYAGVTLHRDWVRARSSQGTLEARNTVLARCLAISENNNRMLELGMKQMLLKYRGIEREVFTRGRLEAGLYAAGREDGKVRASVQLLKRIDQLGGYDLEPIEILTDLVEQAQRTVDADDVRLYIEDVLGGYVSTAPEHANR